MRPETLLRWIAHMWALASTLLLVAFAFGGREHLRFTGSEAVAFLFFPIGLIIGFVIAWWRQLAGGLTAVGSFALFHLWMYMGSGRLWLGPYFLLFVAPGFLYIASSLISRRRARSISRAEPSA